MTRYLIIISCLFFIFSCTIEKRLYQKGFHVNWNSSKYTEKEQFVLETKGSHNLELVGPVNPDSSLVIEKEHKSASFTIDKNVLFSKKQDQLQEINQKKIETQAPFKNLDKPTSFNSINKYKKKQKSEISKNELVTLLGVLSFVCLFLLLGIILFVFFTPEFLILLFVFPVIGFALAIASIIVSYKSKDEFNPIGIFGIILNVLAGLLSLIVAFLITIIN
jgi:hypothetical protein